MIARPEWLAVGPVLAEREERIWRAANDRLLSGHGIDPATGAVVPGGPTWRVGHGGTLEEYDAAVRQSELEYDATVDLIGPWRVARDEARSNRRWP